MQTFLPYPDYQESATVLDTVRLNNQINEGMSIMTSLEDGGGWYNHPATQMWRENIWQLKP